MNDLTKSKLKSSAVVGAVCIMASLSMASITEITDDFSTSIKTFPDWHSVGSVNPVIKYDGISSGDYNDGNPSQKLSYSVGMLLPGDGVKSDGGLHLDSQNYIQGDEAMGLTIGGTMEAGEEIVFSGSVYNDNTSFSIYKAQLWNLTDGTLLAESAFKQVERITHVGYVPVDFSAIYVANTNDAGDTLQIRFLENNNHPARDIFVDSFTLISSVGSSLAEHPRLFFSTNELAEIQSRRFTTHTDAWAQVVAQCEALKNTLPTTTPRNPGSISLLTYEDKLVAMAVAQLVDPSLPYQQTSENWFWTILNWTEWGDGYWAWPNYGPAGNLETGEVLRGLAIWFDLQYHTLTPAERLDASRKLADYADRFRNSYELFWTTEKGRQVGNHCWNAFASLAAVYYTSDNISTARQADWSNLLDGHYATIKNLMNNQLRDGVNGEGGTYWTYGIEKILFWYEMRRVAGEPAFENIDWFANTGTYGIYSILPGGTDNFGGITRFDDANPDYWGNPYNEISLLAKATRDPAAQWISNELDHSGKNKKNAYRYLFYDPTVPTINPATDLKNWHYFDSYGFFLWRTSWSNDAAHFSIRSGQHSHGHSKCDDGQFMIDRAGVPYIANLGYAAPRYTKDSNVLLVDGSGQYSDGDMWGFFESVWPANSNTWGKVLHVLANGSKNQPGDFFNVLLDPTPMYTSSKLSNWQREVVGLGGDLYLLRDTMSANSSAVFDLLLHATVTTALGDTFNQDTYASVNPWTDLGSGRWQIDARAGSPKMLVQDVSANGWSSSIEATWYYHRYDSTPPTRRGNKLKRSLTGTAGTSLVSFGFEDLMAGWTQTAWTDSAAEGVHIVASGAPVLDVLWPLNGSSVTSSDGWNVTGKMAGWRMGDGFFGRAVTTMQRNGQSLLVATTPVSFHAKTEHVPGGPVPNRIIVSADAPSTLTLFAPYEPKSVMLNGVDLAFSWTNNQLTLSIPATESAIVDLVDAAYLSWRKDHFTEAEIEAGLAGLSEDPDADQRDNWAEFIADTDPRDGNDYFKVTIDNQTLSFISSSNRSYTVEYATNLVMVSWIPLIENEPGTGFEMSLVDTNNYGNCFYRVKAALL